MSLRIRTVALALCVLLLPALPARAQEEPEFFDKPVTPAQFWRAIQFEVNVGQYELAAKYLKQMLNANPDEKALIDILTKSENGPVEKRGLVPFLRLRNVPKWSGDAMVNADAKKDVDTLIEKMSAALKNHLSNPDRILFFIKQLIATPEEAEFAATELRRSGVSATPYLLGFLRTNPPPEHREAILALLPTMDSNTVPAQIAFLEIKEVQLKIDVLDALRQRADLPALRGRAETDIIPTLWYFVGKPGLPEILKNKARLMLQQMLNVSLEKRFSEVELTKLASEFALHRALFTNAENVPLWRWDDAKQALLAPPTPPYTRGTAEEFYGLKYTRWALDIKPNYEPAQILFLTLATNGAYSRSSLDVPLAKSSPGVYDLLATAPTEMLLRTLDKAIIDRNSATILGIVQVLGDRGEKLATQSFSRGIVLVTPLLVQLLNYKDDTRVPFAAANALLRIPGPPIHQSYNRITEIMRRAIAVDAGNGVAVPRPKIMIGDRDPLRVRTLAELLNRLGFDTVQASTSREMLARLAQKPDVSVIFVDHSIADPMLPDLLGSLRADGRYAYIPVYIVASTPITEQPSFDTLLQRLALLIATSDETTIPPLTVEPSAVEVVPIGEVDLKAASKSEDRNIRLGRVIEDRAARLRRLVEATDLPMSDPIASRIEELTILMLGADAELGSGQLAKLRAVQALLRDNPVRDPVDQKQYNGRLVLTVTKIESELVAELRPRLDRLRLAVAASNSITVLDAPRDLVLETKLRRLIGSYRRIFVVPEALSELALQQTLNISLVEPAAMPKSPDAMKADAKTAMQWFRKMAVFEIPGYDIKLAGNEIRAQMASADESQALLAIEATTHLPIRDAQLDLANIVTKADRTLPVRLKAADGLIQHMQAYGKLLGKAQIDVLNGLARTEADVEMKNRLATIVGIFGADPTRTTERLQLYVPPLPGAAIPMPKVDPEEKKDN